MLQLYFFSFRSYAALCAEKYRHHQHFRLTIHPYSKLRFIIEFIFVILTVVGSIIIACHYASDTRHFDNVSTNLVYLSVFFFCPFFSFILVFLPAGCEKHGTGRGDTWARSMSSSPRLWADMMIIV